MLRSQRVLGLEAAIDANAPEWHEDEVARLYIEKADRDQMYDDSPGWLRIFPHFIVTACGHKYTYSDAVRFLRMELSYRYANPGRDHEGEDVYNMFEQLVAEGTFTPAR